jgi:hypothetical protein
VILELWLPKRRKHRMQEVLLIPNYPGKPRTFNDGKPVDTAWLHAKYDQFSKILANSFCPRLWVAENNQLTTLQALAIRNGELLATPPLDTIRNTPGLLTAHKAILFYLQYRISQHREVTFYVKEDGEFVDEHGEPFSLNYSAKFTQGGIVL